MRMMEVERKAIDTKFKPWTNECERCCIECNTFSSCRGYKCTTMYVTCNQCEYKNFEL